MWARILEFCLALWLAISPFIFGYSSEAEFYWANDFIAAAFMIFFSLGSFYRPLEKLHFAMVPIGAWLIAVGFLAPLPPTPMVQNYVVVGLVLVMIAVLPNRSEQLPNSWLKFYEKRSS